MATLLGLKEGLSYDRVMSLARYDRHFNTNVKHTGAILAKVGTDVCIMGS